MASAQVVETSVTNNSPSQDSYHPDDLFQSRNIDNNNNNNNNNNNSNSNDIIIVVFSHPMCYSLIKPNPSLEFEEKYFRCNCWSFISLFLVFTVKRFWN